jgi:hypothetical protein
MVVVDVSLKVERVAWIERLGEDLLDQGQKVAEAADRRRGLSAGGSAGDGEEESLLYRLESDAPLEEAAGSLSVIAQDAAEGAWEPTIAVEEMGDVALLAVHYATSGRAAWTWSAETDRARARAAAKREW